MLREGSGNDDGGDENGGGEVARDPALLVAEKDVDYYCRACDALITRGRWRAVRDGSHEHRRFNPGGFVFRILIFAEAPGVTNVGEESLDFTWFAGRSWTIALCAGCRVHLGWRFVGEGDLFFGLIKGRLTTRRDAC